MDKYVAKAISRIKNSPGTWDSIQVGVFLVEEEKETQLGTYVRNYPNLFETFFPFRTLNKDYALYSPDYTSTRVMELPSCKDIGGESPSSSGFCPVEYFVPCYIEREEVYETGTKIRYRVNNPSPDELEPKGNNQFKSFVVTPVTYYPFAFIAGCVWGEDFSWKIQFLDLSKIADGLIQRDDRFGYIELPEGIALNQAIDMRGYLYDTDEDQYDSSYRITIAVRKRFDLRNGNEVE